MAFLYGGSGATDFAAIAKGVDAAGLLSDPLVLVGIALVAVGLAFKTSIAPFHQWTPDVYERAPTPITSFMVVASEAGVSALAFYLAGYLFMNLAAFSAIVARERETAYGDDIAAVRGLG